jgi:serine protease Do
MRWRDPRSRPTLAALVLAVAVALGGCTLPGASQVQAPTAEPLRTAVPPTATVAPTPTRDSTPQEIYRRVSPAVVTILSRVTRGSQRGTAFGTGVIFDRRGYILTNNHVVEGGTEYNVIYSDGVRVSARLIGGDEKTDLAVLQVDGEVPGTAVFGDSSKLEPGQPGSSAGCTANWRTAPARCSRT